MKQNDIVSGGQMKPKKRVLAEWMNFEELIEYTSMSRSAIYRNMKSNKFPKPIKVANKLQWSEKEVQKWFDKKMKDR